MLVALRSGPDDAIYLPGRKFLGSSKRTKSARHLQRVEHCARADKISVAQLLLERGALITPTVREALLQGDFWHTFIEQHQCSDAVAAVAAQESTADLMNQKDQHGRPACAVAADVVIKVIFFSELLNAVCNRHWLPLSQAWNKAVQFCGVIDTVSTTPEHQSYTCVVLRGIVTNPSGSLAEGDQVVVKLMKDKHQYRREIEMRKGLSSDSVMVVHATSDDEGWRDRWIQDASKRGYAGYPYGIVMWSAQRNLMIILVRKGRRSLVQLWSSCTCYS